MFVPFVGMVEIGFFHWIFGIVIIYASVNAVNFTDGVDGLCSSVTVTAAVSLGVIAGLKGLFGFSMAAAALAGACVGFLFGIKTPPRSLWAIQAPCSSAVWSLPSLMRSAAR